MLFIGLLCCWLVSSFRGVIFWRDFIFYLIIARFFNGFFHRRCSVVFVICVWCGRVICCCVRIIRSRFSMASSSQRAVKGNMAKLFTITAFDHGTMLSGMTSFVAVATYKKLIVLDNSAPLTFNIERIWDGWRGKYHAN